jgi:hypothetical protein
VTENIQMLTSAPDSTEKKKSAELLEDLTAMLKELNQKIEDVADEACVLSLSPVDSAISNGPLSWILPSAIDLYRALCGLIT